MMEFQVFQPHWIKVRVASVHGTKEPIQSCCEEMKGVDVLLAITSFYGIVQH